MVDSFADWTDSGIVGGVETAGRRIVVSGDMLELGAREEEPAHRRIGEWAAAAAIDLFVGVGPRHAVAVEAARQAGVDSRHFTTAEQAAVYLAGEIGDGDLVLVKGSRGVRMETVVRRLEGGDGCGG